MVEHLPNIHKVIGLILRTTKKKKGKEGREQLRLPVEKNYQLKTWT